MSTPFFVGFARVLVDALHERALLEIAPDHERDVVAFVADYLAGVGEGGSAITSVSRALLACPHVEELYADDEELKQVIQDLQGTPAAWVSG